MKKIKSLFSLPNLGQRFISLHRFACVATAALSLLSLGRNVAFADKPEIDLSYVNGQLYDMIGPHIIPNASPNLLAHSEELYLVTYPLNPRGATNLGKLTLPSGYQPNCDPCFHPGLPFQFAYHDHVLTWSPDFVL